MRQLGVDVLLLSHGADLPWLTGYRAMPLERLTLLVLPVDGEPELIVPALEAPRVPDPTGAFLLRPWTEDENPISIACTRIKAARTTRACDTLAISDRAWSTTLLALQSALPDLHWLPASRVTGALRAVKDQSEIAALQAAAQAADHVAAALQGGEIRLAGRSEAAVSVEITARLLEQGHDAVNFAIVGSGPNAASPHHEPSQRLIGSGETVVCDFGGALSLGGDVGYCSDITRTLMTGPPDAEIADAYEVLRVAHDAAVVAVSDGVPAESVDQAARRVITDAGLGEYFIHRTGHGIGIEEHEDPYIVTGNDNPLVVGNVFSIEPGIYMPGRFGMRLEDIVLLTQDGPELLNNADRSLFIVDT